MLSRKTVEVAGTLTTDLGYRDTSISPANGSPLARLVASIKLIDDSYTDDAIITGSEAVINYESHTDIEDYTVRNLTQVLGNIISLAKNEIRPLVIDIMEKVSNARKDELMRDHNLINEVVYIDIPLLFKDERFLDLVDKYKNTATMQYDIPELDIVLNNISKEDVNICILTGSPTLDAKIQQYLTEDNFHVDPLYGVEIASIDIPNIAGLFLLLTGLQNRRLDSYAYLVEDPVVNLKLTQLKTMLAGVLSRYIEKYNDAVKRKDIIVGFVYAPLRAYSSTTNFVIGPTYRTWIKDEGGSVEALLGYFLNNKASVSSNSTNTLKENAEIYVKTYEEKLRQIKNINILSDITRVKHLVRSSVGQYIKNLPDDINKAPLFDRLNAAYDREYYGGDYLEPYIIKVICRTLNNRDLKNFLLEATYLFKADEHMTVDDAIYLATIKLICKWIGSQMLVTHNNGGALTTAQLTYD